MTRKTLEEIEAAHMARAARKADNANPSLDTDLNDEDDEDLIGAPNGLQSNATSDDDATPSMQRELEQLRHEIATMRGRVVPSQQQADEYRRLYEDERRLRAAEAAERDEQINALREKLQEDINFDELLTEEERDMLDPMQLSIFKKIAKAVAPKTDVRSETQRIIEEREAAKINRYREDKLTDPAFGISNLSFLAQDPNFISWSNQEENDDFDPLVRSLLSAKTEREIDKYTKAVARRIAKFNESRNSVKAATRKTDAQTSLHKGMQRRPRMASAEEVDKQLAEATRLARSRNPEDRKKAEAILNAL